MKVKSIKLISQMNIRYNRNVYCLQRIDQKKDIGHLPKFERHLPDYNNVPYKTHLCDENFKDMA